MVGTRAFLLATAFTLAPLGAALAQTEPSAPSTLDPLQSETLALGDIAAPPVTEDAPAPEPPPPSRDPDDLPLIDLSRLETEDLRLLYFDPSETYLTPYVARSFRFNNHCHTKQSQDSRSLDNHASNLS